MTLNWRTGLRNWANEFVTEFARKDGVLGVVMGGSLARGQEWRHSDLEMGVLVKERRPDMPYFNVNAGRGVEVIQLVQGDLERQVAQVEAGDITPVLTWHIQLWACRVIADPSGQLGRFKQQFDARLFTPAVINLRIAGQVEKINASLAEARGLLVEKRPAAALSKIRYAFNDAILALHWHHSELPRSQNRTDSRLRWLSRKYAEEPFYALYREVFGLADAHKAIRKAWPLVKDQVLEITRLWGGDSSRDFFIYAVDSDFAWRQNAGILTVYRLYIPIIGGPDQGIFNRLDDPDWAVQNHNLRVFLGLAQADVATVSALLERVNAACQVFERAPE